MNLPDMPWTRRALLVTSPVHIVLGGIGLVMIYPMAISYGFTAIVALFVESLGHGLARAFRSTPDRAHRLLSYVLWIACALTQPMAQIGEGGEGDGIHVLVIAAGIASCWRLLPRDARPVGAVAIVVLLICNITYIWGQAFGRPQALEYIYVTLYGATAVPFAVFAVERTVDMFVQRRRLGARDEER